MFSAFPTLLAQAVDTATSAPDAGLPFYRQTWFLALLVIAVLVVPYLVGEWMGRALRMADYGWKLGLMLTALVAGATIAVVMWPPRLGIDLSGGFKLVYQVDQAKMASANIPKLASEIQKTLESAKIFGDAKATVQPTGENVLAVELPTDDPAKVQKARSAIEAADFGGIGATLTYETTRSKDKRAELVYQVALKPQTSNVSMEKLSEAISRRVNPGGQKEVSVRSMEGMKIEIEVPIPRDAEKAQIEAEKAQIKEIISSVGSLQFRIVADGRFSGENSDAIEAAKKNIDNPSDDVFLDGQLVAQWVMVGKDESGREVLPPSGVEYLTRKTNAGRQILIMAAPDTQNVTGEDLAYAASSFDTSGPIVTFEMNPAGAKKFGQLTGNNLEDPVRHIKHELAVILDGKLLSVASIQSQINDRGQISGSFTQKQVDFIVSVLRAGSLPAPLEKKPLSEDTISAELGRDTIQNSAASMIVSTIAVLLFMLAYYRFAGIVANLAVLLNLLLVLALMNIFHAAFTLAGLAGLVLSVGMAVDSNVLIYERMREEKERGAALRMVIRNGFGRAMTTIIDTHFTTIITGVILYAMGTAQLRGFAATLVMGLVVNLFTAVFCARVVFDIAERKGWIRDLKMMRLFGDTNINFVGWIKPAITVSVIISVLGLWAIWERGAKLLDIDFTGGYSVQIVLNKDMDVAEVRRMVSEPEVEKTLPDATVNSVTTAETQGIDRFSQFIIRTSNDNADEVKDEISKVFGDNLKRYKVAQISAPTLISAPKGKYSDGAGDTPPADSTKPVKSRFSDEPDSKTPSTKDKETPKTETDKTNTEKTSTEKTAPAKSTTKEPPSDEGKKDSTKSDTPKSATPASSEKSADKPSAEKAPPPPGEAKPSDKSGADLRQLRRSLIALAAPQALLADESTDKKAEGDAKPPAKSGDKPSDAKTAEAKSTDDKTTEPKPADTKPSDPKPADTKPADAQPANTKSTDTKAPATPDVPPLPAETTGDKSEKPADEAPEGPHATAENPFLGGSQITLKFDKDEPIKYEILRDLVAKAVPKGTKFELTSADYKPGSTRAETEWTLRLALPPDAAAPVVESIKNQLASRPVFLGDSKIGGRVAKETQTTAIIALVASIAMIVVYIWIRFQNVIFGLGAVVALVHDVLVTLAGIGLSWYLAPYFGWLLVDPFKISLNVVAAMLTIVGYSISDTIVIFDRIREVRGKNPALTEEMINVSVNQTLSRTVLTVFTVLLVTIILYIAGGQAIHAFAFTMLIGLISGTYSSVYIAAPVLLWLKAPLENSGK